jgi:hypothetical protein
MGLGAALVALVLGAKRRFAVPSVRKAHRHDLFLPSEFKLKDSAIEPSAPFGMLAPEKRVRRSKMELLVSLLASTASAIRSLASKLPVERASNFCRSAWQRISAPPATPEQCSSEPLSPGAADSKGAEVPVVVESQHAPAEAAAKGTPVESHAFPPSANPVVPVSAPVEAPSLEAKSAEKSAEKVADQAVSTTTPGQRPIL